jgi:hypothetical protein
MQGDQGQLLAIPRFGFQEQRIKWHVRLVRMIIGAGVREFFALLPVRAPARDDKVDQDQLLDFSRFPISRTGDSRASYQESAGCLI